MNNKLMSYVLKRSGISDKDFAGAIKPDRINAFKKNLKSLRFDISSTLPSDNAQTMSGGVDVSSVGLNCEVDSCKGLFVTGELLDIDGKCGGYNLYLAWTTGMIAGRSAAL